MAQTIDQLNVKEKIILENGAALEIVDENGKTLLRIQKVSSKVVRYSLAKTDYSGVVTFKEFESTPQGQNSILRYVGTNIEITAGSHLKALVGGSLKEIKVGNDGRPIFG